MSTSIDDIYDRIERSQREQQQQQRLNVANQVAPDFDRAARIFAVEANTQLPYDVVDADLDNLEDQVRRSEFDSSQYRDAINGSPVFNSFAAEHPYHISVLERDRVGLTRMERALDPIFQGWDSGRAMIEIAEIRDRHLTDFENPENDRERLNDLRKLTEGGMFGADTWYEKVLVGTAQQLPIQGWLIGESLDEIAIGTGVGAAYGGAMGSTAGGVGALPGAITGGLTGAGRGFMVGRTEAAFRLERGLAYDQYLELGLDEEQARWASNGVGAVNAALESIGIGALTKRLPGFRAIQSDVAGNVVNNVLLKPTFRHAAGRATLKYGEGVATELITEVLQEATLIAGQEYLKSNAREAGDIRAETAPMTSDQFWDSMGDIAAHTLYGTVLIGGMGPGANFYSESKQAWQARQLGSAWDVLRDTATDSEVRQKVPTKYRQFVEALAGKHGNIQMEARRFIDYWQEQGMDPDEVAVSLGMDANELASAEINGHDVQIPVAEYLTKIAPTQHHDGMVKDLKGRSDQMSIREAEAWEANKPAVMKEIDALAEKVDGATEEETLSIIEDVKRQLVEAGTSPEAAENQQWVMVGIPNLARRMKIDARELYETYFGGVVATTNAQMNAEMEDVDLMVDPFLDRIREGAFPKQRDIFGPSIVETIKARGGLAPDAELTARDVGRQIRGIIKDTGDTLDGIAELLYEAGYIADRDPNLVLDALDREMSGEPVFSRTGVVDENQRELLTKLEELEMILGQAGIDLDTMTNKEARDALEALDTFMQMDDEIEMSDLEKLTRLAFTAAEHDPSMLARLAEQLPEIAERQDFGDVAFVDTLELEEGGQVTRTRKAQREFELASKRRNTLKKLKDCVGG